MPKLPIKINDISSCVQELVFCGTCGDAARFASENDPTCFDGMCGPYDTWYLVPVTLHHEYFPAAKVDKVEEECEVECTDPYQGVLTGPCIIGECNEDGPKPPNMDQDCGGSEEENGEEENGEEEI